MEAIRKVVRKNPKNKGKTKHEKLSEQWGVDNEPVKEGVTFYVKYLGSTLVEELDEGESYGNHISAEAIKTISAMTKATGKKILPKMAVTVSPYGIKVINMETHEVFTDLSIYRISFCSADKNFDKVFAYIARNTENETMECHAFLCAKRKVAQAVTLTVAQAFAIAKDDWEDKEVKEQQNLEKQASDSRLTPSSSMSSSSSSPSHSSLQHPSPQHLVDIETHHHEDLVSLQHLVEIETHPPEVLTPPPVDHHPTSQPTLGFEDNFIDIDPFAEFAESRSRSGLSPNPFKSSQFGTDLHPGDVDESLRHITRGQQLSDMTRTPSVDDLLCL